jgi:hypothetical protein
MLTIDAIHHRITALERRLGTLEPTARTPSSCNARSIICRPPGSASCDIRDRLAERHGIASRRCRQVASALVV